MGDYNAELPSRSQSPNIPIDMRSRLLLNLMSTIKMVPINTTELCSGAQFSNIPYNSDRETLIDHIFLQELDLVNVTYCHIFDDSSTNVSTHRPICCNINLQNELPKCADFPRNMMNWHTVKDSHIENYKLQITEDKKLRMSFETEILSNKAIDNLYNSIVSAINSANENCIPKSVFKPYIKPYWDDRLKVLHKIVKHKRYIWINENRPRGNSYKSYTDYKKAKHDFRQYHRNRVSDFLKQMENEKDEAADIDNNEFWRLINRRRKKANRTQVFEMKFDDTISRTPQEINTGWKNYFEKLYSPVYHETFNEEHLQNINAEVEDLENKLMSHQDTIIHRFITEDVIERCLKTCKKRKACGADNVYYENLMYGGSFMLSCLTKLFQNMARLAHIPVELKRGIITTMYKGGSKKKSDPNSYRAISLCSTILKLYEKVLLNFIESDNPVKLNPLYLLCTRKLFKALCMLFRR
ncbi:uncharacterized protein LOC128547637 [Mercenaria mercenaria]|uniref:uncharacterized protein LOC128547637 n=1 Tax=Mercenaria mercenaria TaxID=6596 RepID=UPI00234E678A|nr:uncharacterized protein LOC128547637 [Mercenaria mercenaria]